MGLGFSHKIYEPLSGAVAKDCADICWSCVATSDYGSLRAPISERGSQARNGSDCATLIRRIAVRTLNLAMCLLCAFHVPTISGHQRGRNSITLQLNEIRWDVLRNVLCKLKSR